jgi:hypothetical protein
MTLFLFFFIGFDVYRQSYRQQALNNILPCCVINIYQCGKYIHIKGGIVDVLHEMWYEIT